jgi:hypothetical protein
MSHELTFLRDLAFWRLGHEWQLDDTAFCRVCHQEITAAQWARDEPCPGRKQ